MDVVAILGALAEQGVTALLKADGERVRARTRPWTFRPAASRWAMTSCGSMRPRWRTASRMRFPACVRSG